MKTEILLYTDVQAGDAARFREQLAAAGRSPVVRINSPGGSVFDGLAMANAITAHGNVTIVIDGLAASIASLIAISGRRVTMATNALMMIHMPWMQAGGTAEALRRDATALDKATEAMLSGYTDRTGRPADEITALMAAETWFTAAEALAFGLVDSLVDPLPMAAALDLSKFENIPPRIKAMTETTAAPQAAATETAADLRAALIERNSDISARYNAFCYAFPGRVDQVRPVFDAAMANLDQTPDQFTAAVLAKIAETPDEPVAGAYSVRVDLGRNHHHGEFRAAAVDAMLMRGHVSVPRPHPGARDVLGMSTVQIAETLLSHRGRESGGSPLGTIRAAMTTSDFPMLLSDTAERALMRGYENEPASHRIWTRETFARNFKPQSRVAISEAPELLEKKESAEYRDGRLHDVKRAPNFQLVTYGRMLSISREALVNDDLQAITRLPEAFGASAARKEADVVYGLLTSNPLMTDGNALFSEAHSNLASNLSLSVYGLSIARANMRKQKGPNGGYLNPVPRYLIVSARDETTALQLVAAERIETTPVGDETRTVIAPSLRWVQELIVVVDPRLDDDASLPWYLAASHEQIDTAERVYLEGQRGVFTEEEQNFSTDEFRLKARLDFAATIPDWVGLYKAQTA